MAGSSLSLSDIHVQEHKHISDIREVFEAFQEDVILFPDQASYHHLYFSTYRPVPDEQPHPTSLIHWMKKIFGGDGNNNNSTGTSNAECDIFNKIRLLFRRFLTLKEVDIEVAENHFIERLPKIFNMECSYLSEPIGAVSIAMNDDGGEMQMNHFETPAAAAVEEEVHSSLSNTTTTHPSSPPTIDLTENDDYISINNNQDASPSNYNNNDNGENAEAFQINQESLGDMNNNTQKRTLSKRKSPIFSRMPLLSLSPMGDSVASSNAKLPKLKRRGRKPGRAGGKKFTCDLCSKKVVSLNQHKYHVHSDVAPFKCPQPHCGYKAKTKQNLHGHMSQVHSDLRPFKCLQQNCDFATKTKQNLDRHTLQHTGVTRFKCQLCSFVCKHKRLLNGHMKLKHKSQQKEGNDGSKASNHQNQEKKVYKCKATENCLFYTESEEELVFHLSNSHKLPRIELSANQATV